MRQLLGQRVGVPGSEWEDEGSPYWGTVVKVGAVDVSGKECVGIELDSGHFHHWPTTMVLEWLDQQPPEPNPKRARLQPSANEEERGTAAAAEQRETLPRAPSTEQKSCQQDDNIKSPAVQLGRKPHMATGPVPGSDTDLRLAVTRVEEALPIPAGRPTPTPQCSGHGSRPPSRGGGVSGLEQRWSAATHDAHVSAGASNKSEVDTARPDGAPPPQQQLSQSARRLAGVLTSSCAGGAPTVSLPRFGSGNTDVPEQPVPRQQQLKQPRQQAPQRVLHPPTGQRQECSPCIGPPAPSTSCEPSSNRASGPCCSNASGSTMRLSVSSQARTQAPVVGTAAAAAGGTVPATANPSGAEAGPSAAAVVAACTSGGRTATSSGRGSSDGDREMVGRHADKTQTTSACGSDDAVVPDACLQPESQSALCRQTYLATDRKRPGRKPLRAVVWAGAPQAEVQQPVAPPPAPPAAAHTATARVATGAGVRQRKPSAKRAEAEGVVLAPRAAVLVPAAAEDAKLSSVPRTGAEALAMGIPLGSLPY